MIDVFRDFTSKSENPNLKKKIGSHFFSKKKSPEFHWEQDQISARENTKINPWYFLIILTFYLQMGPIFFNFLACLLNMVWVEKLKI